MPAPFQLLASHPVLDFVNTLDNRFVASGPNELIPEYEDLLAFMEQSKLLEARHLNVLRRRGNTPAASNALRGAHELRERLAAVLYPVAAGQPMVRRSLNALQPYFIEAYAHRELIRAQVSARSELHPGVEWSWAKSESNAELPLWAVSQCAADLLTSSALQRVHECGSPTCRWLFLDTSKNHSRRWCDMSLCGNRMKARRFQDRQHLSD
jgi:predicted RNA-binding Zn ribbon-like protein